MTEMKKIMTVVVVVVLIMSMVLFTMFEPDTEYGVSSQDILGATNAYLASGVNSIRTPPRRLS